jgi:hypothetical protein
MRRTVSGRSGGRIGDPARSSAGQVGIPEERLLRPVPEEAIEADRADLHKLGYAQELLRSMGGFSNFAISF